MSELYRMSENDLQLLADKKSERPILMASNTFTLGLYGGYKNGFRDAEETLIPIIEAKERRIADLGATVKVQYDTIRVKAKSIIDEDELDQLLKGKKEALDKVELLLKQKENLQSVINGQREVITNAFVVVSEKNAILKDVKEFLGQADFSFEEDIEASEILVKRI